MTKQNTKRRRGMFVREHLTEIAVIFMIVCLVGGLLLPVLQQDRGSRRNPFKNKLKQLSLGVHNFSDIFHRLPPHLPEGETGSQVKQPISFLTSLLPFMEHQSLYETIDTGVTWDDPVNRKAYGTTVDAYVSPYLEEGKTKAGFGITHLSPNSRVLSMKRPIRMEDIADGAAHTILFGSIDDSAVPAWGDPVNRRDPARGFAGGPHAFGGLPNGGAFVALGDGQIRYLGPKTDPKIARALASPAGGEVVENYQ